MEEENRVAGSFQFLFRLCVSMTLWPGQSLGQPKRMAKALRKSALKAYIMGLREEFAHPNHTKMSKVVGLIHGRLRSQNGTMQLRTKKGNQQHTNTPIITDRVFSTLVSLLKDILKELSESILQLLPMLLCRNLALSAALSSAEILLICFWAIL